MSPWSDPYVAGIHQDPSLLDYSEASTEVGPELLEAALDAPTPAARLLGALLTRTLGLARRPSLRPKLEERATREADPAVRAALLDALRVAPEDKAERDVLIDYHAYLSTVHAAAGSGRRIREQEAWRGDWRYFQIVGPGAIAESPAAVSVKTGTVVSRNGDAGWSELLAQPTLAIWDLVLRYCWLVGELTPMTRGQREA